MFVVAVVVLAVLSLLSHCSHYNSMAVNTCMNLSLCVCVCVRVCVCVGHKSTTVFGVSILLIKSSTLLPC